MDTTKIIAINLTQWMAPPSKLDTLKKVAARSGVGFGTVQRARNGEGNITVQNLIAIAQAFGRPVEGLLRLPEGVANIAHHEDRARSNALIDEIMGLIEQLDDDGRWLIKGQALLLLSHHAKEKNRAS
jgi:transcriptional regulator with XRE-family HTH domain